MRQWSTLLPLSVSLLSAIVDAQYIWAPLYYGNWTEGLNASDHGGGRSLLDTPHMIDFMEKFGIADDELIKPDGSDKRSFFEPDASGVIQTHDARQAARKRRTERHKAMRDKERQRGRQGTPFPQQGAEDSEHFLQEGSQPLQDPNKPDLDATAKPETAIDQAADAAAADQSRGAEEAGENKQIDSEENALRTQPTTSEQAGSKRRRGKRKANVQARQNDTSDSIDDCHVYVLDLSSLAAREGIPPCDAGKFSAHPLTQRLLPDPAASDPGAQKELDNPPDTLKWTFPFTAWPHHFSQHGAPWYLKKVIQKSKFHTTNISEATVVLVDDYCYLSWAIADLHAKGHWWLDSHKHYSSNFKAGQHLLDLYHAMAHEKEFMHKQGRNFLFVSPLTSFDFGDWKTMDDYVAMSCEHFSNSMHIVFDQVQRWRCGRYRPDRSLVAPLSVSDAVEGSLEDAERDLTFQFRGNCEPENGKDPLYAGKRLRKYLVKLFSKAGSDVSVRCTDEDKSGLGPAAVEEHAILPHAEYMREMGRSKFCIMIPGETQNTPRLTEAFLAGCVPVFIGPPWHAMPYPEVVNYKEATVTIHISDISRWADFGAKWVLEKNAPRDTSRLHPKWWTPQVSAKDMDEMHAPTDLAEFLRDYPEDLYKQKRAAVYKYRKYFMWAAEEQTPPAAADIALQKTCRWGKEESKIMHMDI